MFFPLCLEADCAVELLRGAFAAFPGRAHALLSLPHGAPPPPPLAAAFSHVRPLPGAELPDVVLLMHRDALHPEFQVRAPSRG